MKAENMAMQIFEYQTPATLNQAAPVKDTWYTVLDDNNVRVWQISVGVEDTNETLEVRITIDGEEIDGIGLAATHSTNYYVHTQAHAINRVDGNVLETWANTRHYNLLIDGASVKIEVRKTTAAGVGNLTAAVMWGKLRRVG